MKERRSLNAALVKNASLSSRKNAISSRRRPRRIVSLLIGGSLVFVAALYSALVYHAAVQQHPVALGQWQQPDRARKGTETTRRREYPPPSRRQQQPSSSSSAVAVLSRSIRDVPHTVHKLSNATNTHKNINNTIVTAYFRLKSKYSASKYDEWMQNMLSLQDPMVIFTETALVATIQTMRQHASNSTVIIEMQLQDVPIASLSTTTGHQTAADFWEHQLAIDRERRRHASYQLFWIWLSKSWFVTAAATYNFFDSAAFMWSDIGCFRNRRYNDKQLLQHVSELLPDSSTVLWMAHHPPNPPDSPIWNDKFRQKEHYYHSGSQAIGCLQAWKQFHAAFAETVDAFVRADKFIGEDQCVLQGTCQSYPHLCAYLPFSQVQDNHYFGLRYALYFGQRNNKQQAYQLWRAPAA